MRVFLAYDGSEGATVAARFVEHVPWPVGTTVEVVGVVEPPVSELPIGAWPPATTDWSETDETDRILQTKGSLDEVARTLGTRGLRAEPVILHGMVVEALLARVDRDRPDLVVAGTRRLGGLRRVVLGSVSSALVDRSAVPVVVARGSGVERVVLATDGSEIADEVVGAVAAWRFLARSEIRVLSVAPERAMWWPAEMVPGLPSTAVDERRSGAPALAAHRTIAADAADRLRAVGLRAQPETATGPAGSAIAGFARDWQADLVVVGSHGRTGVTRLVLGSVARDVLHHAPCSVVIVRRHGQPLRSGRRASAGVVRPLATI
jgi:nucleotide-binding universal stress UspA family protein